MSLWHGIGVWFTTASNWDGPDGVWSRLWLQAQLSLSVIGVAAFAGVGAGFLLGHLQRGGIFAVNAANAARAIPSLALITLIALWPPIGLKYDGFPASFIALAALGIPPVLTNSYVGMRDVDRDVREAAKASGMTGAQSFWRVEVPLAVPLAVAGVRIAAVEVVATATLAAYASFNDLGGFLFTGFDTNDPVQTFCGALLVAVLAAATDLLLAGAYRLATPAALRRSSVAFREQGRGVVKAHRGALRPATAEQG